MSNEKPMVTKDRKIVLLLTTDELHLVLEGLDAHRYYELSDPNYRDSGFIRDPGSDDPENAETIRAVDALEARLEKLR